MFFVRRGSIFLSGLLFLVAFSLVGCFFLYLNALMLMVLLIMMASCSPQMTVAQVASSLPLVLAGRLLSGISLTNADLSIEQRK